MKVAPIILFTYNRLEHTKNIITALKNNVLASISNLYIFSDAPKNEINKYEVNEVRNFLKQITGFKKVEIIERDINFGLSNNIIDGVTEICNRYGRVIVLEDDLITSPYFLTYMNEAINIYNTNESVGTIHGYVYPTKETLPNTFFIKGADCWGWATWSSAWCKFEKNGVKLLNEIRAKSLEKEFNFNNNFDYVQMLEDQIEGKNNSWAIRWYASCFLNNLYTLYPGKSLVSNIGFDNSGTHSGESNAFNQEINSDKIFIDEIPVENSVIAYNAFSNYFRKQNFYNSKFKKTIKKIIPKQLLNIYRKL
jgi:hypothetical protein